MSMKSSLIALSVGKRKHGMSKPPICYPFVRAGHVCGCALLSFGTPSLLELYRSVRGKVGRDGFGNYCLVTIALYNVFIHTNTSIISAF